MQPAGRADALGGTALQDLIFRLDELRCGLDVAVVLEILPALAVRPLPGQPPFVAGTIDLRGTTVPVLDLRVRFGRAPRPLALSDRFIVARARGRVLAIWVDAVDGIASRDPTGFTPAGGLVVGDRSLVGVSANADGLCAIHDFDGFVSACESDALAEALAS